jgi:hypothetical protein
VCGKSARTVRPGGGRKRAHGNDYTGTKLETADTAKSAPTEYRAGPRPYHLVVRQRALGCALHDVPPNVLWQSPRRKSDTRSTESMAGSSRHGFSLHLQ